MVEIRSDEVDFSHATAVISGTQKFIVPVPAFPDGGEPLVVPDGEDSAGRPIVDWQGLPIGDRGIVFWNDKDQCWQAAVGDGTAVVILNEVSEEQARALHAKFLDLGASDVTLAGLKQFLAFARSLGLRDYYHSDLAFVRARMTPVRRGTLCLEHAGATLGFVKRDERDVAQAVYVERPFVLRRADGSFQKMPRGGAILRVATDVHAVQPDVFLRTYRLAEDGCELDDLARSIHRIDP
jgi:hypothetical protein